MTLEAVSKKPVTTMQSKRVCMQRLLRMRLYGEYLVDDPATLVRQPVCLPGSGDLSFDQFSEHPFSLHEFLEGAALHNFSGL